MKKDESNSTQPASTIPPDDPRRNLTIARPDEDQNLPHIGLVGDTYKAEALAPQYRTELLKPQED